MSPNLRPLLTEVETRLTAVSAGGTADNNAMIDLQRAWNALVEGLDLPPEPKLRACHVCGREIRCAATLCGYCWSRVPSVEG